MSMDSRKKLKRHPVAKCRGSWSAEEDAILSRLVQEMGVGNWSPIARALNLELGKNELNGRIGKQCRERWNHHLMPDIKKEPWSANEERLIADAHSKLGNRWSDIARLIPGRSENAVKNHWNATLKRRDPPGTDMTPLKIYMTENGLSAPLSRKNSTAGSRGGLAAGMSGSKGGSKISKRTRSLTSSTETDSNENDGDEVDGELMDNEMNAVSQLHQQWQDTSLQPELQTGLHWREHSEPTERPGTALPMIDWGLPTVMEPRSPVMRCSNVTQDAQNWLSSRHIMPSAFDRPMLPEVAGPGITQEEQQRIHQRRGRQQRLVYPEQQPGGRAVVKIATKMDVDEARPMAASPFPASPASPFPSIIDGSLPSGYTGSPLGVDAAGLLLGMGSGSPSALPEAGSWRLDSPLPSLDVFDVMDRQDPLAPSPLAAPQSQLGPTEPGRTSFPAQRHGCQTLPSINTLETPAINQFLRQHPCIKSEEPSHPYVKSEEDRAVNPPAWRYPCPAGGSSADLTAPPPAGGGGGGLGESERHTAPSRVGINCRQPSMGHMPYSLSSNHLPLSAPPNSTLPAHENCAPPGISGRFTSPAGIDTGMMGHQAKVHPSGQSWGHQAMDPHASYPSPNPRGGPITTGMRRISSTASVAMGSSTPSQHHHLATQHQRPMSSATLETDASIQRISSSGSMMPHHHHHHGRNLSVGESSRPTNVRNGGGGGGDSTCSMDTSASCLNDTAGPILVGAVTEAASPGLLHGGRGFVHMGNAGPMGGPSGRMGLPSSLFTSATAPPFHLPDIHSPAMGSSRGAVGDEVFVHTVVEGNHVLVTTQALPSLPNLVQAHLPSNSRQQRRHDPFATGGGGGQPGAVDEHAASAADLHQFASSGRTLKINIDRLHYMLERCGLGGLHQGTGPEEDRTMWAVQDLSRLLHCLSGWACRSYNLRCLHIAIRLGGREDSSVPHNTTQGNGATDGNSVVVAVGGTSSSHQAALASAFVNKELNNVLMA